MESRNVCLRDRQNAEPLKMATPQSLEPAKHGPLHEKWDLADVIRVRLSRRDDYPGLPSAIPKVIIIRCGQEARGQGQRDAVRAAEVT